MKYKGYTIINMLGLSFGVLCCLLILMFVADERGYDRNWPTGDRLYRMALERIYPDRKTRYAIIPSSYAQTVQRECPEVEAAVRVVNFNQGGTQQFKLGDQVFEEKYALSADSTFFTVFRWPLLKGDAATCLDKPNTVVLTASTARRYFGDADPVGQTIRRLDGGPNFQPLTVTAICEDLPENAHLDFDLLMSTTGARFLEAPNHISFSAATYLLLKPGMAPAQVEARFDGLVEKYAAGEIQRNFGVSWPEYKASGNGYHYFLQAIGDIHLSPSLQYDFKPGGSAVMVNIFTVIALFILLIACINFMNLATARSAERAREVGVRKALGGERQQLAFQFLTEAILVSVVAVLVGLGLTSLLLPAFNELAQKNLQLSDYLNWKAAPALGLLALGVGLLAGAYPALVLSGFKPIEVLKGKFSTQKRGLALRNGLVVFQFAISVALIVSTLVVLGQMRFIADKPLGFNKDHVLILKNAGHLGPQTEAFKQALLQLPGVVKVGGTSEMPGGENYFGTSFKRPEENETITGRGIITDDQFMPTLQIDCVEGRGFSKDFNDSLSVVLNEKAVKDLGLGPNPVGKKIVNTGSFFSPEEADVTFTVIGVTKDFHYQSLHEKVVPLFLYYHQIARRTDNLLAIRVQSDQNQAFIEKAESLWRSFVQDQPFRFSFLESDLAVLYDAEQRAQQIFALFAFLAVFIACIGLLGLAAYMTQQRTKEIGVRKVLGASIASITGLLAKDFVKLVVAAILVATPVAWYGMNRWLDGFAYRIQVQWWMFALAGLIAVSIAFVTVGFQSVKAAMVNPVKSLRSE